jgi:hypothetical protein
MPKVGNPMAPLFSKIPVAVTPNIPVISGLMCKHADCYALFSSLEDSQAHADAAHAGNMEAISCVIYERTLRSGEVQLYRVLDENGEHPKGVYMTEHSPLGH